MDFFTRPKDEYECRIANGCPAEEWMYSIYLLYPSEDLCDNCPFMKIVNKLGEYEDNERCTTLI